MSRRLGTATAGLLALSALAPAAASAEKEIRAQTAYRFDALTYSLDQGEALKFFNGDFLAPAPHNVTSVERGPDNQPLFESATYDHGGEGPVRGAQQRPPLHSPLLTRPTRRRHPPALRPSRSGISPAGAWGPASVPAERSARRPAPR